MEPEFEDTDCRNKFAEPASMRAFEPASIILFTATDPEFTATGYDFLLRMKDKQDFLRGMTSFYV